ncbi:MAG: apolipoprotein N-acyltransferase [Alphaproteobacteria bacterium]|nr:apolipoprotein N-acyltransferase [Alphaproteobacteria bacterium]
MAVTGAVATLAFSPFFILPCFVVSVALLLMAAWSARSARQAFLTGWWWGFGHFVTGFYWMSISLLVEPEKFAWLIPFAVSLIPAAMACYLGVLAWAAWFLPAYSPGKRAMLAACAWVFLEMLRAWLFSGLPWNLAGYVWNVVPQVMQFAAALGVYGLSFLAVWLSAALAVALRKEGRRPLAAASLILLAIAWWGESRLREGAAVRDVPGVTLRLVQPNIAQQEKWLPDGLQRQVEKLVRLSTEGEVFTHVIWPETALPIAWDGTKELPPAIVGAVPKGGALLTGVVRVAQDGIYNSLVAIDDTGSRTAAYDKAHLVPFGEYVPFRSVLPLEKITHGMMDFSEGPPGALFQGVPGLSTALPQICYEGIFPGPVRTWHFDSQGILTPRWILNVTNDAWFGNSTGPYQHFEMTRLRAVEAGLPLVRVANTGITGVVDAYGVVRVRTQLGEETFVNSPLPGVAREPTLFSYAGSNILWLIFALLALWALTKRYGHVSGK